MARSEAAREVLVILNSLSLGALGRVEEELRRARRALDEMGEEGLRERLEEASEGLKKGDLREFRRAVSNVTARLGHLK